MYMEEGPEHWYADSLFRRPNHPSTCTPCRSITFSTTYQYWRRMVQRIRRPRAVKPNYWPNIIHRLRNNLLTRDTQAFMEPLPNPRTKNNKSSRGLAQQDKEADSTRTPKHLFRNACTKSGSLRFSVFRLLTDFVCLYNYEFWLSLCKIVRSSVIFLLPYLQPTQTQRDPVSKWSYHHPPKRRKYVIRTPQTQAASQWTLRNAICWRRSISSSSQLKRYVWTL